MSQQGVGGTGANAGPAGLQGMGGGLQGILPQLAAAYARNQANAGPAPPQGAPPGMTSPAPPQGSAPGGLATMGPPGSSPGAVGGFKPAVPPGAFAGAAPPQGGAPSVPGTMGAPNPGAPAPTSGMPPFMQPSQLPSMTGPAVNVNQMYAQRPDLMAAIAQMQGANKPALGVAPGAPGTTGPMPPSAGLAPGAGGPSPGAIPGGVTPSLLSFLGSAGGTINGPRQYAQF